jgi:hypothetical protein
MSWHLTDNPAPPAFVRYWGKADIAASPTAGSPNEFFRTKKFLSSSVASSWSPGGHPRLVSPNVAENALKKII